MTQLKIPLPITMRKYGLTADEWVAMADAQGDACAICRLVPTSRRLNIDHAHAKGWAKMPPEQRKLYVRGLACFVCNNRILSKGVTSAKLRAAADYLDAHAAMTPSSRG